MLLCGPPTWKTLLVAVASNAGIHTHKKFVLNNQNFVAYDQIRVSRTIFFFYESIVLGEGREGE